MGKYANGSVLWLSFIESPVSVEKLGLGRHDTSPFALGA